MVHFLLVAGPADDVIRLGPAGRPSGHLGNRLVGMDVWLIFLFGFYRAMHFSAKRGIAIACRLSVRPSVRLSVTLVDCDHIGWNSSKIITPLVSLGCSLFATPT